MTTFTQDWFSHNISGIKSIILHFPAKKSFLEIGSFEGRSTCWFLENALDDDGTIICIDTFTGSQEHAEMGMDFTPVKDRFKSNINEVKKPTQDVGIMDMQSHIGISKLMSDQRMFDFIYVDGSHSAPDVITDACMAFHLLKSGGVMLFDDYLWSLEKPLLYSPKVAVDAFTMLFKDRMSILMIGYQLAIKKI